MSNETRYPLPYLRAWREQKHMSQAQLSAATHEDGRKDVSKSTIIRLENEQTAANGVTVERLASALGITRDQLINEAPGTKMAPPLQPASAASTRARGSQRAKSSPSA